MSSSSTIEAAVEGSATAEMGGVDSPAAAAAEDDELELGVQALLQQIASPTNTTGDHAEDGAASSIRKPRWDAERKAYPRKLQTFTASAYFAKPASFITVGYYSTPRLLRS